MPKRRRATGRPDPRTRSRAMALALGGVLLLQIALAWGRLDLPFLDGRIHYNYDNAGFSFQARTGILLGGPRSQLGVTSVPFASWGKPAGFPSYYTHHPFLFKALFQLWMRLTGDAESSSRSFALTVSMAAAAGTVVALAVATGSVLAALLGTAVMVATPVFAIHQVCIKYEIEGMAIGAWLLATTFIYLERPTRRALAVLAILAFLAPLAHWTALFLSVCVIAWLIGERLLVRASGTGRPLMSLIVGTGVGTIVLFAAFAWLQGGWAPYWRDQAAAILFRQDASALPPGAWSDAQRKYVGLNFTWLLPWIAGLATVARGSIWARRRISGVPPGRTASGRALPAFFFSTLATACVWQFGFLQSSFVHLYTQLWFALPLAALIAGLACSVRRGIARQGVALAACLLVIFLAAASHDLARRVLAAQSGTPEDIRFLRSLRTDTFRRLVFVPLVQEPPSHWFDGPIGPYYTDRPVTTYDGVMPLGEGDKVLVPHEGGRAAILGRLEAWAGIVLTNETCGGRLCAYDVRKARAVEAESSDAP